MIFLDPLAEVIFFQVSAWSPWIFFHRMTMMFPPDSHDLVMFSRSANIFRRSRWSDGFPCVVQLTLVSIEHLCSVDMFSIQQRSCFLIDGTHITTQIFLTLSKAKFIGASSFTLAHAHVIYQLYRKEHIYKYIDTQSSDNTQMYNNTYISNIYKTRLQAKASRPYSEISLQLHCVLISPFHTT